MRVQKIMNENESIKLFFRHQASIRRHFMTHAFAFISLILFTQLYNMDCFSLLLCEFRIVDDINSTSLFKMSERGKIESELFPTALTFFPFTHATHLLLYHFFSAFSDSPLWFVFVSIQTHFLHFLFYSHLLTHGWEENSWKCWIEENR